MRYTGICLDSYSRIRLVSEELGTHHGVLEHLALHISKRIKASLRDMHCTNGGAQLHKS